MSQHSKGPKGYTAMYPFNEEQDRSHGSYRSKMTFILTMYPLNEEQESIKTNCES